MAQTVYGSPIVVALRATVLPLLATQDVYLESPQNLVVAAVDCRIIMELLDEIAAAVGASGPH